MPHSCPHPAVTVDVPAASGRLTLHRCARCDESWWTLDGLAVDRELAHATVSLIAPAILRRRRRRVVSRLPAGR